MVRVKATREGDIGKLTATGYRIDTVVPFVALPSTHALYRFVRLRNPANGAVALAVVLDVGPWNEHDDAYVFGVRRPAAENGRDERNRVTNGAGIDLSERIWFELGMKDNAEIEWEFLSVLPAPAPANV